MIKNFKKDCWKTIVTALSITLIFYLLMSFIVLDLNALVWPSPIRELFSFLAGTTAIITAIRVYDDW